MKQVLHRILYHGDNRRSLHQPLHDDDYPVGANLVGLHSIYAAALASFLLMLCGCKAKLPVFVHLLALPTFGCRYIIRRIDFIKKMCCMLGIANVLTQQLCLQ